MSHDRTSSAHHPPGHRGSDSPDPPSGPAPSRRDVLKGASIGIQALLGAAVAVPWLGAFAFPLWGKVNQKLTGFVPVGAVKRFPVGEPKKVVITGDSGDAWSRTKDVSLGAAWVVRAESGEFSVYSTTCPHLGCAVNFDPANARFLCPCHGSHFTVSGARIEGDSEPNPSPRDMDSLEWKVEKDQLLVRYERFRTGTEERIVLG